MEWVDDLENSSRHSNLRIINILCGSEKDQEKFVCDLLKAVMSLGVFINPLEIEQAHHFFILVPGDVVLAKLSSLTSTQFPGEKKKVL